MIEDLVISIGAYWVALIKFLNKYLEEVLVPDTAVEHLFDECFFVGIFYVF